MSSDFPPIFTAHYILWSQSGRTARYCGRVDPLTTWVIALVGLTALNALGWGWNTLRGTDARMQATCDAATSISREALTRLETLESQKAGDRMEHLRQVEELAGLVADNERVRASAAAAVNRRERKAQAHVTQEEVPPDRESQIAAARRHFSATG